MKECSTSVREWEQASVRSYRYGYGSLEQMIVREAREVGLARNKVEELYTALLVGTILGFAIQQDGSELPISELPLSDIADRSGKSEVHVERVATLMANRNYLRLDNGFGGPGYVRRNGHKGLKG